VLLQVEEERGEAKETIKGDPLVQGRRLEGWKAGKGFLLNSKEAGGCKRSPDHWVMPEGSGF